MLTMVQCSVLEMDNIREYFGYSPVKGSNTSQFLTCDKCGGTAFKTTDTRLVQHKDTKDKAVLRSRVCLNCNARYRTLEYEVEFIATVRNGRPKSV